MIMKTTATFVILFMMAVSLTFLACGSGDKKIEPAEQKVTVKVEYTCPMHPEIIRNEHGKCPICGMDLVEKKSDMHDDTTDMHGK